jgi:hypothetical protein
MNPSLQSRAPRSSVGAQVRYGRSLDIQPPLPTYANMGMDPGILVILGAPVGAAVAFKYAVEFADALEKAGSYYRRANRVLNRAIIRAKIYSRRRSSRFLNFFSYLIAGHAILGPEDDPPPRPPGGGRKMRPRLSATVGFGTLPADPKVAGAAAPRRAPASGSPVSGASVWCLA